MKQNRLIFITICIVFFTSAFFSLAKGSVSLSFTEFVEQAQDSQSIIWQLRVPRTAAAFVCGALLALSGSLMQLLLQNPLADPYVLGVSSGSAFFTLLFMMIGISDTNLGIATWSGSLITILAMFVLAGKHHWQSHTLLLSGIAMAFGFSAGISLLLLMTNDATIHSMLFWLSGDLSNARFPWFGLTLLTFGFLICWALAPGLNILARGEKEALALGLHNRQYQIVLYFLCSLFTAEVVSLAGCIGFIGLIIPHLGRGLAGYDHRILLPVSGLLGSSLLMSADTLARTLIAPQQLPVGILLTLLGVPIFIWLIRR